MLRNPARTRLAAASLALGAMAWASCSLTHDVDPHGEQWGQPGPAGSALDASVEGQAGSSAGGAPGDSSDRAAGSGGTGTVAGSGGWGGSGGSAGQAGSGGAAGKGGAGGSGATGGAGSGGSGGCPPGTKWCPGGCVSKSDVLFGCGSTGCDPCRYDNAQAFCNSGTGQCAMGACVYGAENCDGNESNGCEAFVKSDPRNCGKCGNDCTKYPNVNPSGPLCKNDACDLSGSQSCQSGYLDCDGQVSTGCETKVTTTNCGTCGLVCAKDFTCYFVPMFGPWSCGCSTDGSCSSVMAPGKCVAKRCQCPVPDAGTVECPQGKPCASTGSGCAP